MVNNEYLSRFAASRYKQSHSQVILMSNLETGTSPYQVTKFQAMDHWSRKQTTLGIMPQLSWNKLVDSCWSFRNNEGLK